MSTRNITQRFIQTVWSRPKTLYPYVRHVEFWTPPRPTHWIVRLLKYAFGILVIGVAVTVALLPWKTIAGILP